MLNFFSDNFLNQYSLFQSNAKLKQLWIFASILETKKEMLQNYQVHFHGVKIVSTLEKILKILIKPTDEHDDHVDLLALGRQHYGYVLIFEYNIILS